MDIHKFDDWDGFDETPEEFYEFTNELEELFKKSPEFASRPDFVSEHDFSFVSMAMQFLFDYIGVLPWNCDEGDIVELLDELLPRKLSLGDPEKEANSIPEVLYLFWPFLEREFDVKNSKDICEQLEDYRGCYVDIMTDSSRFGIAKGFMSQGSDMGFDMTSQEGMEEFRLLHNKVMTFGGNMSSFSKPKKVKKVLGGLQINRSLAPKPKKKKKKKKR